MWKIEPYNESDKRVGIKGPHEIYLEVDTDDVDKEAVMEAIHYMVKILCKHEIPEPIWRS